MSPKRKAEMVQILESVRVNSATQTATTTGGTWLRATSQHSHHSAKRRTAAR